VHLHPQGGEKHFGRNLQGKFASAPPGGARVNFRTFLLGGGYLIFGGGSGFSSFSVCFEGDD